jgi:putative flippase GtrA
MEKLLQRLKDRVRRLSPAFWQRQKQRKSIVKFIIIGFSVGALDLISLYIFHGLFRIEIVRATSLAFLVSFTLSFSLQKFYTFSNNHLTQRVFSRQIALYLAVNFININLNGAAMFFMVKHFHVWYLLSQLIVSSLIGLVSFVSYKFVIFRQPAK